MIKNPEMFNFSTKLWYEKRRVNPETGETSLYLQVVIDRKSKAFSLKLRWPADFIDLTTGKLLARRKKDPEVNDYNLIIEAQRAKHTEIQRMYRIRGESLDLDKFSHELKTFDARECFTTFIEKESKRRLLRKEISIQTCRNAHVTQMRCLDFDKLCLFKNMDEKWMKRFKFFLLGKGYKIGTVWTIIKTVKTYLRLARLEPMLFVHDEAADFPNTMPKFKTTFLTLDEVRKLIIMVRAGSLNSLHERVLKGFLFTCLTSIRISDLYNVNATWRIENDFLEFIPFKNRHRQKQIKIPLMDAALTLVEDIAGQYFDLPTMPEFNRALKNIASKAGIKKRLCSHVGRHTFGYLYMTRVGNLKALQEIMGHADIETTERYAHIDDEYKLESIGKIQSGFNDLFFSKKSAITI